MAEAGSWSWGFSALLVLRDLRGMGAWSQVQPRPRAGWVLTRAAAATTAPAVAAPGNDPEDAAYSALGVRRCRAGATGSTRMAPPEHRGAGPLRCLHAGTLVLSRPQRTA